MLYHGKMGNMWACTVMRKGVCMSGGSPGRGRRGIGGDRAGFNTKVGKRVRVKV